MGIELTKFKGKAPVIQAVLVTSENIEEIAVFIGADQYSVEKTLVGGGQRVTFFKFEDRTNMHATSRYPRRLVEVGVGEFLVKYPARVTEQMDARKSHFFRATDGEFAAFIRQSEEKGEVDITPPYDR